MSTNVDGPSQSNCDPHATVNVVSPDTVLTGHSGRRYVVKRVLQKKENSPLGVYLAKYDFFSFGSPNSCPITG